jgi:hypothetical protein
MHDVLLIILGWLFGMLAPALVERVRRDRDSPNIRKAIRLELNELRYKLALVSYQIQTRYGKVDRNFLLWLRQIVSTYEGIDKEPKIHESLNSILALQDDAIAKFFEKQAAAAQVGLSLKKYVVPHLEARMAQNWQFDDILQSQLLDVFSNLSMINEDIELARYYFRLTFETLSDENHSRATENFRQACRHIGDRCRYLVDRIDRVSRL